MKDRGAPKWQILYILYEYSNSSIDKIYRLSNGITKRQIWDCINELYRESRIIPNGHNEYDLTNKERKRIEKKEYLKETKELRKEERIERRNNRMNKEEYCPRCQKMVIANNASKIHGSYNGSTFAYSNSNRIHFCTEIIQDGFFKGDRCGLDLSKKRTQICKVCNNEYHGYVNNVCNECYPEYWKEINSRIDIAVRDIPIALSTEIVELPTHLDKIYSQRVRSRTHKRNLDVLT